MHGHELKLDGIGDNDQKYDEPELREAIEEYYQHQDTDGFYVDPEDHPEMKLSLDSPKGDDNLNEPPMHFRQRTGEKSPLPLRDGESEGKYGFSHMDKKEAQEIPFDLQRQWRKQIGAPSCKEENEKEMIIARAHNTAVLMTLEDEDEPISEDEYYEYPMDEFKGIELEDVERMKKHSRKKADGFIGDDEGNKHDPLDLGNDEFILKPDSVLKLTLEKQATPYFHCDPEQI